MSPDGTTKAPNPSSPLSPEPISFGGCDYLGLAENPRIHRAIIKGLREQGLTVSASRVTTGNHRIYGELENKIAQFFGSRAAILAPNGYLTNQIVLEALADEFSSVAVRRGTHPSAVSASRVITDRFRFGSPDELRRGLKERSASGPTIVITDGVDAIEGGIAPLPSFLRSMGRDDLLLVDDAHGAGILGTKGRGTPEYHGLPRRRIVQTVTFSKAFGVYGGAIIGNKRLRKRIFASSQTFAGTTPLPLPLVYGIATALDLVGRADTKRRRLKEDSRRFRRVLFESGFDIDETESPIIALSPRTRKVGYRISGKLEAGGIRAPLIRYPGSKGDLFRFALSIRHRRSQTQALAELLAHCEPKSFAARLGKRD